MRKENLITEISIDPASHAVELRGSTGQVLGAEQLSVGERQMLAVALLWGLARAAGQPLPVVIDTPLGRLDSSHRHHLLDRYFPFASHQVILLSTDTEISADAWSQLAPSVGHAYRLEFDPTRSATTVHRGYFWGS
jgi:DNA sulfur modification protein DndD